MSPAGARIRIVAAVALLLALHFAMAVASKLHESTTSDEIVHVTGGFSYWRLDDYRLHPENGNLAQRWVALPVWIAGSRFPTLDQPYKVKIPEGTQSGGQIRIRHRGVPAVNGGPRGDLYVHIEVRTPARLTREQRKLIEQLRDTLPVDNAPAEKGLFEKVKNYFT